MEKLGFIGVGNMANAIISSILNRNILNHENILVYDVDSAKVQEMAKNGVTARFSPAEVAEESDYLLLAVKPQHFETVLKAIKGKVRPETVVISIAAGISARHIKNALEFDCKVVLVMPNTPLLIGHGSTAMAMVAPTSQGELDFVCRLFEGEGTVERISSEMMAEVIPLNGSSPAFIYRYAQLFVEMGQSMGFKEEVANRLFCHSLIGAAKMMLESGKTHEELIKMVSSPGGTTIAGLKALDEAGFPEAVRQGIRACVNRAHELGKKD